MLFLYFLICLFQLPKKKNNSNKSKTYVVWIKLRDFIIAFLYPTEEISIVMSSIYRLPRLLTSSSGERK